MTDSYHADVRQGIVDTCRVMNYPRLATALAGQLTVA